MSALLLDLLTQKQPQFETHQALLVLDFQNDFLSAHGKLPVRSREAILARVKRLVPIFRDTAGDVIWVRTVYEQDRPANDGSDEGELVVMSFEGEKDDDIGEDGPSSPGPAPKSGGRAMEILKKVTRKTPAPVETPKQDGDDSELFLTASETRQPCCLPNSKGAEFAEDIKKYADPGNDVMIKKTHYSAFKGTQLLMTLRMRLITELFICGCMSNISIYATALDAARHGLTINIVEDCLGYRKISRHEEALRQMAEVFGAYTATSTDLIQDLADQDPDGNIGSEPAVTREPGPTQINSLAQRLSLSDTSSLYSSRGEGARGSVEHRRNESGNVEPPSKASLDTTPLLGRKRSARFLKRLSPQPSESKKPIPQPPESPTAPPPPEPGERTLKYKRSKIRMRKREQSVGSKDRKAAPDVPSQVDSPAGDANRAKEAPPQLSNLKAKDADDGSASALQSSTGVLSSQAPSDAANVSASSPRSPPLPGSSKAALGSGPGESSPSRYAVKAAYAQHSASSSRDMAADGAIGEGDSYLSTAVMPKERGKTVFWDLYNEVRWQVMHHQTGSVPRLVCVQGEVGEDGSTPIYRHPTDHSLPLLHYSPSVQAVREYAEKIVEHPLNHVLIQLYRSGQDYISEHSDKTLDIVRGSNIVNVSFGAQRTMRLRTKKSALDQQSVPFADSGRQTQRVALPHNSAFVLGQETNMRWLHGINPDKRPQGERSREEKAYDGMRISLTFRHIGTFLDADSASMWGQGATAKSREEAAPVINNDEGKTEALIHAFGKENQATEFKWPDTYGAGFDVLNFRDAPGGDWPLLFLSTSGVENDQVRIYLDEADIKYSTVEPPPGEGSDDMGSIRSVCFRDCDALHTEVTGALAVLIYLDRTQPLQKSSAVAAGDDEKGDSKPAETRSSMARTYELLISLPGAARSGQKSLLRSMDARLANAGFIAGERFGIADCAYFPVMERFWGTWREGEDGKIPRVKAYLARVRNRVAAVTKLKQQEQRMAAAT